MNQYQQYVCYIYALPWHVDGYADNYEVWVLSVFYGVIKFTFEYRCYLMTNSDFRVYNLINSIWVQCIWQKAPLGGQATKNHWNILYVIWRNMSMRTIWIPKYENGYTDGMHVRHAPCRMYSPV